MNQQMMNLAEEKTYWIKVNKGDSSCRALADRHRFSHITVLPVNTKI